MPAARPARTFVAAGLLPALVGWALLPATSQVPCKGKAFAPSLAISAADGANASPLPPPVWTDDHLTGLDPWGDSDGDARDLIAVYQKPAGDLVHFRVDVMDLQAGAPLDVFLAVDHKPEGNTALFPDDPALTADVEWDVLLTLDRDGQGRRFDAAFADRSADLALANSDPTDDFVEFAIPRASLPDWDGAPFRLQALSLTADGARLADRTNPDAATGRGKLVLVFGNLFANWGPAAVSWYDGFAFPPPDRPAQRSGSKVLFHAVEKYGLPITTLDLRADVLPGNEYLGLDDRLRDLAARGLLDPLFAVTYGYFLPWQPADVDARAIRMARDDRRALGLPAGEVMVPYEAMLTAGDLESIRAGFSAVYAYDHFGDWFGQIEEEDWADPARVADWFRRSRKLHRANDLLFFFGLHGFHWDSRWNDLAIEPGWFLQRYDSFVGTDGGLHHAWRRVLLDLALDPDQEQYITMGTDLWLTSWYLPQDADRNLRWIAAHPWIEATTFTALLERGWTPVDHGDLGLAPDEPLDRYYPPQPGSADYFWQSYSGGLSDGHSALIPAGTRIEAYADYVPYLRDGRPIPSGRRMGDDRTPDTIVYETLRNLRAAPENALGRLAWRAYFMAVAEQTFHAFTDYPSGAVPKEESGGPYLHPAAKSLANLVRQANKIAAAAAWAESAAEGQVEAEAQVVAADLDLDGEDEFVLRNDRVFAIFEDGGGRLEFAFAFDPATGPVALVAPMYLTRFPGRTDFAAGESPADDDWIEAAFEDAAPQEGRRFRVERYAVEAGANTVTFTSPDGRIRKTFRLEGETLLAHYATRDLADLSIAFALPVGLAGMYSPDWWEGIQPVTGGGRAGWRSDGQGYAAVKTDDVRLGSMDSFLDSTARAEMREPDPGGEPYPAGHWLPFPFNTITVVGQGEFDLSLTLSAVGPEVTGQPTPATATSQGDTPRPPESRPSDLPSALTSALPFCLCGLALAALAAVALGRRPKAWRRNPFHREGRGEIRDGGSSE